MLENGTLLKNRELFSFDPALLSAFGTSFDVTFQMTSAHKPAFLFQPDFPP